MISMNTARALLAIAACMACSSSFAQTKPDGLWRGTGGAALAITSGNSEASSLAFSADGAVATAKDKISLGGAYNYGKSKVAGVSTTNTDKWNGFGQYDYNLSPQLFVFGKLGLEGDKLSDLDLRATLAGGLGFKVVDTKELMFNLFGGAAYSADKYSKRQTIGGSTDTRFSRTSLFIGEESAHQLSASTSFKQRLEFYPGLSGDKAKIAKFTAGLAVAMSSTLNLTVGVTDSYNSAPPAGTKKNDLGIFSGISVKLGSL
jgi:putative salt-induced outer membrane protein